MRKIMITGGLGFIGSNLVRYWCAKYPTDQLIIVDAETYAARPNYIYRELRLPNVVRERLDIRDQAAVSRVMAKHRPEHVIHLAAESHVCRSISGPKDFVTTNINGTFNLLEEFRTLWPCEPGSASSAYRRFHHVSTDEVFGQLGPEDCPFNEETPLAPRSPYATSKAASDLLVKCYFETYGLNAVITNCSNNFGPNQHEEKLIPRAIERMSANLPMTLYGNGLQIREWLFVMDHCKAIDCVFHNGTAGERYCVGGDNELPNTDLVRAVHEIVSKMRTGKVGPMEVVFTNDRPKDDFRYAINNAKIMQLGWAPSRNFEEQLILTVSWYLQLMTRQMLEETYAEERAERMNAK